MLNNWFAFITQCILWMYRVDLVWTPFEFCNRQASVLYSTSVFLLCFRTTAFLFLFLVVVNLCQLSYHFASSVKCVTLALLGNVLLWASNQSVLHVCVISFFKSSESLYGSSITCRVIVSNVGQHLSPSVAEWQMTDTTMSYLCIFLVMKDSVKGKWHWCGFFLFAKKKSV